jgi:hypothetical protein
LFSSRKDRETFVRRSLDMHPGLRREVVATVLEKAESQAADDG